MLSEYVKTGSKENIANYLAANSSLPGPRGNLELAAAFEETIKNYAEQQPQKLWNLAMKLADVSPTEAPVNSPKEFLPFCGVVTAGAIGSIQPEFFRKALDLLKKMAKDPRWRTREGVAMGIQELIAKHSRETLKELESWIEENEWLTMRAVAGGTAEPALLKNAETARSALELHKRIISEILGSNQRKSDEFKTLRQALGYSLSVIICAAPKEGFEFMRELASSNDADIVWVVKENLKKNRLTKNFPNEVASIKKLLP